MLCSMFEALAEAIDSLESAPQSDAVVELLGLHQRLGAKVTMAVAALEQTGDWQLDGSVSMTAWLRNNAGLTNQGANRILKVGRRLRDLPGTADAWLQGRLTDGQVEVIVANVTDRRVRLFAEQEADVLPLLEPLEVTDTFAAMRRWAERADALLDDDDPPEQPAAKAHFAKTLDGRGYLNGSFDADGTETIAAALRLAMPTWDPEDHRSHAERQGQAMVDVFRWFLDHQGQKLGKRHRPHVNVVIGLPDLERGGAGRSVDGLPFDAAAMRRLLCDANVHRVITDGRSSILDYGRATRTIPPAVYTSLLLRDLGCRYPGCDRPGEWCEGHHIWHWERGGPTRLDNLVLLCSRHHHLVHMKGWHIKLRPDGAVEVTQPDGTVRTGDPPLLC